MHESDLPTATDDPAEADDGPVADPELDSIADELDTVEAAMKALDDDLDQAEALAASLEPASSDGESSQPAEPDSSED